MFETNFGNIFYSLRDSSGDTRITFHSLAETEEELDSVALTLTNAEAYTEETVSLLKHIVGESRLERIFKRPELELDWEAFNQDRLPLTKDVLKRVWMGMADVRLEDMEERGSATDSVEKIDEIFASLLPSKSYTDIFLDEHVNVSYYDKAHSSGKKFAGLQERVWTALNHREHVISGVQNTSFADLEMLTSRFIEREPPTGSVIRLSTGYYVADRIISGGGAYVTIWKNLSAGASPLLVCRGSASRRNATEGYMSVVNDFLPEIGFYGIRTIWPELKKYLSDQKITKVDVCGKSLGGAHAQYLTALITGLTDTSVRTLRTYCSVGIPESVQKVFEQALIDRKKMTPTVEVYRNGGDPVDEHMDYIPYVGGVHLVAPGATRIIYAIPEKDEEGKPFAVNHNSSDSWKHVLVMFRSLGKAHARQNSLKAYSLTESHDIKEETNVGKKLEPWRSLAASIFNAATLGTFKTETFEHFYKAIMA